MKQINTTKAPAAIGPYSQGFVTGNILFSAGQIPLDAATGEVVGDDITAQTEQVMKNLGAILKEAGSSFEKTLKTTCFLSDMGNFAAFNEVYGKYFTGPFLRGGKDPSQECAGGSGSDRRNIKQ